MRGTCSKNKHWFRLENPVTSRHQQYIQQVIVLRVGDKGPRIAAFPLRSQVCSISVNRQSVRWALRQLSMAPLAHAEVEGFLVLFTRCDLQVVFKCTGLAQRYQPWRCFSAWFNEEVRDVVRAFLCGDSQSWLAAGTRCVTLSGWCACCRVMDCDIAALMEETTKKKKEHGPLAAPSVCSK